MGYFGDGDHVRNVELGVADCLNVDSARLVVDLCGDVFRLLAFNNFVHSSYRLRTGGAKDQLVVSQDFRRVQLT